MKNYMTLLLAAVFAVGSTFSSQAGSSFKKDVPLTLHMDINNRQTPVYDGYTSYVMGNRASDKDTFTVTKDSDQVDLKDVTLSYYLITYNGSTEKNLECRVYGLKEGEHYPVIRPETFNREKSAGNVYDSLERCYMVEFSKADERKEYYFTAVPESDMASYRNIHLGKWEKDAKGWRYQYQGEYLTSWAKINEKWYLFNADGYMLTGWQESMGQTYYLNPSDGVMMSNCTIDGRKLDGSGAYIE